MLQKNFISFEPTTFSQKLTLYLSKTNSHCNHLFFKLDTTKKSSRRNCHLIFLCIHNVYMYKSLILLVCFLLFDDGSVLLESTFMLIMSEQSPKSRTGNYRWCGQCNVSGPQHRRTRIATFYCEIF